MSDANGHGREEALLYDWNTVAGTPAPPPARRAERRDAARRVAEPLGPSPAASSARSSCSTTWRRSGSTPPTSATRRRRRRRSRDVVALAGEIGRAGLSIWPNCAGRTTAGRHRADRRGAAALRRAHRGPHLPRLEPDPPVRRGLGPRLPARGRPSEAIGLARSARPRRHVRDRGHDPRARRRPARPLHDRDRGRRDPHLPRRHRRARDAVGRAQPRALHPRGRRGHRARTCGSTGTATATAAST